MDELQPLTDREIEILDLLVTGKTNKEIARDLHISANTVKVHVRNIFGKLNVASRTEASMVAFQEKIISREDPGTTQSDDGAQHATDRDNHAPHVTGPTPGLAPGSSASPGAQVWIVTGLVVTAVLLLAIAIQLFNPADGNQSPTIPENVSIESPWTERASLPQARSHAAAVALENQIYVIGGEIDGQPSASVIRLDPETGEWVSLADKPTPVADVQAAVLGGLIYVPGGRSTDGADVEVLEIYHPLEDTWEAGPDLPARTSGYAMVAHEGKLYVFGGQDGAEISDRAFVYNPDSLAWRELAAMPEKLVYAGAAAVGSRIYVVGGYDGSTASRTVHVFFPAQEGAASWDTAAEMPEGRYGMGLISLADKIHLIGGLGSDAGHFTQMDLTTPIDHWEMSENPLAGEWAHIAAAALGTEIYGLGGELNGEPSDRALSYQVLFVVVIPVIQENP